MTEALRRGGPAACRVYGHTWPIVPSIIGSVLITGPQRDRCYRCGEVRVIHADGSRTHITTETVSFNNNTETETDMSTTIHLPEVCDELSAAIVDIEQFTDNYPLNLRLQNAINGLRTAIKQVDFADREMHRFYQERVDSRAVDAIKCAIHDTFASDGNVEGARGMLMDIEASGSMILQAIRDAGYVISPAPPL